MNTPVFDMVAALKALRECKGLSDKDGILTQLIKQITDAALQAELEVHLGNEDQPCRKNCSNNKTVELPLAASSWPHCVIAQVASTGSGRT